MVKYYSADIVMTVSSTPIKQGVVAVNEEGVIEGVYDSHSIPDGVTVKRLAGVLIPGFVNTHCHVELSHLLGKIPQHTGLPTFLSDVMSNRNYTEKDILSAMKKADEMMFKNGIQAVGDHVNSAISAPIKEKSKIIYHTFVEIIGVNNAELQDKIDHARDIEFHFDPDHSSITPHAPYSCTKMMFKAFKKAISEGNIISIHNQESDEENKLFRYNTGDFLTFYAKQGVDMSGFKAQARNSLQSYLPYLPVNNRIILVHNTFTSLKDIDFINRMNKKVVLCLCPKANLYIENTLPKLPVLEQDNRDITIGTDSLASNDTLDILEELKTIHTHYPDIDFNKSIRWATLNGAKALGLDAQLGSIEVGKAPGLVLLKNMQQLRLTKNVQVERIV